MTLLHRVVIVTGASAGIGRATAQALAAEGADVVLAARREQRLEKLVEELATLPGRRLAVAGNIGDEQYARRLVERTAVEFGRIDVLVNNAGVGQYSRLEKMPTAHMRLLWETNVQGLMVTSQAAVPTFRRQGGGHIVNVSSIVGQAPVPMMAYYSASKSVVNFLSRAWRSELKPYGIRVTLVYPGRTATEFGQARLGRSYEAPINAFRVPAERVARAIVGAIRRPRDEVYVTWPDWLYTHLTRLFPRTFDWILRAGLLRES